MSKIEKDSYVRENQIEIPLMNFWVIINIDFENLLFPLDVYSDGKIVLRINFNNLEEAIDFTQNTIKQCKTKEELLEKYQEILENEKKTIISLTANEVDQAIIDYYGSGKDYRLSVEEEVSIIDGQVNITFYLIEHFNNNTFKISLTREDIKNILKEYISYYNYDLIDFKYITGINKYYFYQDTPYYNGLELTVKEKELTKKLTNK